MPAFSEELKRYHRLHEGLSEMIEEGRLTRDSIPDDYDWLVAKLTTTSTDNAAVEYLDAVATSVDSLLVDIEAMQLPDEGEYVFGPLEVTDACNGNIEWPNLAISSAQLRQLMSATKQEV